MDQVRGSVLWLEKELSADTADPKLSISEEVVITEEVPTLTVAAIVGFTVVMIVAIVVVFVLGILIDCRQQRVIAKQMGEAKRWRAPRRINVRNENDGVSIAHNMEATGISLPPAEALSTIP
ncbi:uncharacterized protein LOC114251555 [Bombyx mandarina]|nr:uncharacterized protein LOC101742586 isoform X2 [Bombyx mori]XP_012544734.1 uncharacterized protein LOC101742586 isoform X2 [Bombyx mori]XP_028041670.1 uncharacterized protein LOC114251555 [Bombyx mandarina]